MRALLTEFPGNIVTIEGDAGTKRAWLRNERS